MKLKYQGKRLLTMFVMAMFLLTVLAGCGGPAAEKTTEKAEAKPAEKQIVIGATMLNVANEFVSSIKSAMEEKAKEMNVKIIINDGERSAEKQVQQIESFIAQKVDAIILNPCEVEASSPAVDKAIAAGIPIINVNSETKSTPTAFVGSNDEEAAQIAMNYIIKKTGGKGNMLMMHGYMGQAAQIKRAKGAMDILSKTPDIKLLAEQTAEWDRAKAMALMENWIQTYGDKINAVFCHNDEMGMGALKALQAAKIKDKVVLVSVDAIADALQAVKDGTLDATVFQDARGQGAGAVETAVKLVKKEKVDAQVMIPFKLVTIENVDQFLKK